MFKPGKTIPQPGEIRLGYVNTPNDTHKYTGVHPYLIVSNYIYNKHSGQCECIPFSTKRFQSHSPSHVDFKLGEVDGLKRPSTLVVEGRDTIRNECLSDPIGMFTEANWKRAVQAMFAQTPCMAEFTI